MVGEYVNSRCPNGKGNNDYQLDCHHVRRIYHYTHEHEQYECINCWERFTPLLAITKDKKDPESYISKTLRFFRWKTVK